VETVVIGSGLSGLTVAAYLARAGCGVTVFEQFPHIGGVTATLKREGFGWDLGPLLLEGFGPGEIAHEILTELGVVDQVRAVRDDRGICFPDFALWKPETYRGPYWRRESLEALFPEEAEGLDRYYRFYDQMMDLMALARRAEAAKGVAALFLKLRAWLAFRGVKKMESWSAARLLDHFFRRPELKAVFTGILADFVVLPSEFPGLGIPACNPETSFDRRIPLQLSRAGPRSGYYYVIGGIGKVVEALAGAISASGGKIETGTAVEKILLEGERITGVRLADGREVSAEVVLASGGAKETLYGLVGKQHLSEHSVRSVEALKPMESVLMVHLGIDTEVSQYQPAALCYYYGSYDIEDGVRTCREGHYHEGRDGFLIYVPSMHSFHRGGSQDKSLPFA